MSIVGFRGKQIALIGSRGTERRVAQSGAGEASSDDDDDEDYDAYSDRRRKKTKVCGHEGCAMYSMLLMPVPSYENADAWDVVATEET